MNNPEEDCDIICIIKLINKITHGSRTYEEDKLQENLKQISEWIKDNPDLIKTPVKKRNRTYPSPLKALILADRLEYVKKLTLTLKVEWDDPHIRAIKRHIKTLKNKDRIKDWQEFLNVLKPIPVEVEKKSIGITLVSKKHVIPELVDPRDMREHPKEKGGKGKKGGKRKKRRYNIKF